MCQILLILMKCYNFVPKLDQKFILLQNEPFLLQNTAALLLLLYYKTKQNFIIKHVRWFITKWAVLITKHGSFFLLLNKTRQNFITKHVSWFITKWAVFITKHGRYYKMSRLLQNAAGITKWAVYYKTRHNMYRGVIIIFLVKYWV